MDILVVGDLNIDIIIAGLTELPTLGTERVGTDFGLTPGGSAANMACTLAALGASVSLAARVGRDMFGDLLIDTVSRRGVDTFYVVRDPDARTGVTACLACGCDRAFATFSGAVQHFCPDDVGDEMLDQISHLHISGYYLVPRLRDGAGALLRRAQACDCTTSLDVGFDPSGSWSVDRVRHALQFCDYFLPNETELQALTAIDDPMCAARDLASTGATVVTKLGGDGSLIAFPNGDVVRSPGFDIKPLDTTGCGDAFNAAFIKCRTDHHPIDQCLRMANACGALCATRIGGSEVVRSAEDVAMFARRHRTQLPLPQEEG